MYTITIPRFFTVSVLYCCFSAFLLSFSSPFVAMQVREPVVIARATPFYNEFIAQLIEKRDKIGKFMVSLAKMDPMVQHIADDIILAVLPPVSFNVPAGTFTTATTSGTLIYKQYHIRTRRTNDYDDNHDVIIATCWGEYAIPNERKLDHALAAAWTFCMTAIAIGENHVIPWYSIMPFCFFQIEHITFVLTRVMIEQRFKNQRIGWFTVGTTNTKRAEFSPMHINNKQVTNEFLNMHDSLAGLKQLIEQQTPLFSPPPPPPLPLSQQQQQFYPQHDPPADFQGAFLPTYISPQSGYHQTYPWHPVGHQLY